MKQYWQKKTNQQNHIFQIWLTWFFENKGDFWKFYSFLETITITIKITMRNVIMTKTDKPTKPYISNLAYLILRK